RNSNSSPAHEAAAAMAVQRLLLRRDRLSPSGGRSLCALGPPDSIPRRGGRILKTLARFAFVALGTLMAAGLAAPAGPETTAAALRDRIVAGSRGVGMGSHIT